MYMLAWKRAHWHTWFGTVSPVNKVITEPVPIEIVHELKLNFVHATEDIEAIRK